VADRRAEAPLEGLDDEAAEDIALELGVGVDARRQLETTPADAHGTNLFSSHSGGGESPARVSGTTALLSDGLPAVLGANEKAPSGGQAALGAVVQTRRRFGGRQPLWGTGVWSSTAVMRRPVETRPLTADS